MYGNRHEFEECQNRGHTEEKCCCIYFYPTNKIILSLPVGFISGLIHSWGFIKLWKHKKPNQRETTWEEKAAHFLSEAHIYFITFVLPQIIEHVAEECFADVDERLVESFNTVFTFILTSLSALYFHPDNINHDPQTKTSIRIYALLSYGGNMLALGHMPYEKEYNFNDYFDNLKQPIVYGYLIFCGIASFVSFSIWFILYRNHDNPENDKKSVLTQSVCLMTGNLVIHVLFSAAIHYIREDSTSIFSTFGLIVFLMVLTAVALLGVRSILTYKDPVYMVTMMCGMDVINRAVFVAIVYNKNFSCSMNDNILFFYGIFGTFYGLAGLLFKHGNIMNEYLP